MNAMKNLRSLLVAPVKWVGLGMVVSALAGCAAVGLSAGGANVVDSAAYCGTTSQQAAVHYFATESALARWIDYRGIDEFGAGGAANGGAIVVEMGQRMTGGYKMKMLPDSTKVDNDTLYLGIAWEAPPEYAAISQAMTSPCVVIAPPAGDYDRVVVVDQLDNVRGTAVVD